jgi:hypothetical protein
MAKGKPTDPLDPVFLIEHAERLTTSEGGGRPPTIDSRRAASAAYYSAYHAATRGIAQFLFGDSWLPGVRWLSHRAVIDATGLVSRLGPVAVPDPGSAPDQVFASSPGVLKDRPDCPRPNLGLRGRLEEATPPWATLKGIEVDDRERFPLLGCESGWLRHSAARSQR